MEKSEFKKVVIECECGCHLLQVASDVEYFDDTVNNSTRVRQDFNLAMFQYGYESRSVLDRLKIAFKYLKTGKMFADQLLLTPDEAKKLADFINDNIVPTER